MYIEEMPDYHDYWTSQDNGAITKHRVNHLLALFRIAAMLETPQGRADTQRLANELWRVIERLPIQLSVSSSGRYW